MKAKHVEYLIGVIKRTYRTLDRFYEGPYHKGRELQEMSRHLRQVCDHNGKATCRTCRACGYWRVEDL
jgi:hypothetical protein